MGIKYLPAVDGLRAVAVLAVVAYHAGLAVPAGFVGVDIFFVISGYLITRLLHAQDGRIDFLDFYARRARRILPAAGLVVVATLAVSMLLLPTGKAAVAESASAAGLFVANLYFQHATGDYWSADAQSMPLLHLWSLSVEEQFYLLWPLLLLLHRRWMLMVAAASLLLAEALLQFNAGAAFYQMPARAWELAAGGLVALYAPRIRGAAWIGSVLIVLAVAWPLPHFPGVGALPAVIGAALIIAAAHHGDRVPWLEAKPVVWIGLISYSLYLWHWPLLAIDRALRVGEAPLSTRLVICGVAIALAILTYRYVEQPIRRGSMRAGRAVAAGAVCAMALSGAAFALASVQVPARPPMVVPLETLHCQPWGPGTRAQLQPARCVQRGPMIALWGDSYADPWAPWALSLADRQHLPAVRLIVPSCPPVLGVTLPLGAAHIGEECRERTEQHVAYLKTHEVDTLIVSAHWAQLLRDRPDADAGVIAWAKALPHVRRIVVIGAQPELRDSIEKCVALGQSCDISRAEYESAAAPTKRVTRTLDTLPNVEIVEFGDWLCDAEVCLGVRDGVALYREDNHHVSYEAVAAFLAGR